MSTTDVWLFMAVLMISPLPASSRAAICASRAAASPSPPASCLVVAFSVAVASPKYCEYLSHSVATCVRPLCANMRAVCPSAFWSSTDAPAASSAAAISLCPRTAAAMRAVVPSLSFASTSAFAPMRAWTTFSCPSEEAAMIAVMPSSDGALTSTESFPCSRRRSTIEVRPRWAAWTRTVTLWLSTWVSSAPLLMRREENSRFSTIIASMRRLCSFPFSST
mmetsp:Transcript_2039/g.4443  ORF Transcript_2039/g.4443 Transcript_2039/m.4443 type:complete len:221 (-) Transcript_2039:2129-2791(-)